MVHVASGREWRGGQRQVLYLAEALARSGAVRQLVVTGSQSRLARELASHGLPVAGVSWGPAFDPRALFGLVRRLHALAPARPVLHAHDSHALSLAALAAALRGLPLVATRRVDFPLRRPLLWRRAARVIAISRAVARVARESGISPDRLVVVPSGIPLDAPPPMPLDLRAELGLPDDVELAASVGALVPHKDFATLVEAAARLRERRPRLHWVVAGDGPLRPDLEGRILTRGLRGRVHLLGWVPDGRPVIAAANLCAVSSREEGLNTSVLDAMRLGVPVVSTDAGGLPEALAGEAGLLVPVGDAGALAAAVERVLEDAALRGQLIARGHTQVATFSAARMAATMVQVYHSVAPAD